MVDGKEESEYSVKWQDFFSGHVVGECMLALCRVPGLLCSLFISLGSDGMPDRQKRKDLHHCMVYKVLVYGALDPRGDRPSW